jgi:hypothetical protein
MKHVTFAEKSFLTGDLISELLLAYAKVLGQRGDSDTVAINAIGPDGNAVEARMLLNPSTILIAETASSNLNEPDNTDSVRYIQDRIDELTRSHDVVPESAEEQGSLGLTDY